jgi:hypothetical protein
MASVRAAPCYIVLCNGTEVAVIEKDLTTGMVRSSNNFLVHTNHDVDHHVTSTPEEYAKSSTVGNEDWLVESTDRKDAFQKKWERYQHTCKAKALQIGDDTNVPVVGSTTRRDTKSYPVPEHIVKRWILSSTTTADCTHFACVMDPKAGQVRLLQRGPIASWEPAG